MITISYNCMQRKLIERNPHSCLESRVKRPYLMILKKSLPTLCPHLHDIFNVRCFKKISFNYEDIVLNFKHIFEFDFFLNFSRSKFHLCRVNAMFNNLRRHFYPLLCLMPFPPSIS